MKFGRISVAKAESAVLAHSVRTAAFSFKKGRVLRREDIAALKKAGVEDVFAATLEAGDVPEDEAARRLALAAAGDGLRVAEPFTGRANFYADAAGILVYDRTRLDALNLADEATTIAALEPFAVVSERQMVATVKIIPFSVPGDALAKVEAVARNGGPLMRVAPLTAHDVGLIVTRLGGQKESLVKKTIDAIQTRVEALGSRLKESITCDHDEAAIAEAISTLSAHGCTPILIFAASAIVDRRDVIPAGIERSGGDILHFGMPVDPGNLLLLGRLDATPVIGLPGCARSPKLNGWDWVLQRLLADVALTAADIARMGAGGLLKEMTGRPQPREGGKTDEETASKTMAPEIAGVVLAAGASRRMGKDNKLLAEIDGKPMVAHVVDAVIAAGLSPVVVVTGHDSDAVEAALVGRDVALVHNPDYDEGLSASLKTGVRALPSDVAGALVCLGDMPRITPKHLRKLVSAFDPEEGRKIVVPTTRGKRGNPILWSAEYFAEMQSLAGDVGAKHLIGEHAEAICEVALEDEAIFTDIDTPRELEAARTRP
jgi:molybdenum cofactor cytidylyltransferase